MWDRDWAEWVPRAASLVPRRKRAARTGPGAGCGPWSWTPRPPAARDVRQRRSPAGGAPRRRRPATAVAVAGRSRRQRGEWRVVAASGGRGGWSVRAPARPPQECSRRNTGV